MLLCDNTQRKRSSEESVPEPNGCNFIGDLPEEGEYYFPTQKTVRNLLLLLIFFIHLLGLRAKSFWIMKSLLPIKYFCKEFYIKKQRKKVTKTKIYCSLKKVANLEYWIFIFIVKMIFWNVKMIILCLTTLIMLFKCLEGACFFYKLVKSPIPLYLCCTIRHYTRGPRVVFCELFCLPWNRCFSCYLIRIIYIEYTSRMKPEKCPLDILC